MPKLWINGLRSFSVTAKLSQYFTVTALRQLALKRWMQNAPQSWDLGWETADYLCFSVTLRSGPKCLHMLQRALVPLSSCLSNPNGIFKAGNFNKTVLISSRCSHFTLWESLHDPFSLGLVWNVFKCIIYFLLTFHTMLSVVQHSRQL